MKIGMFDSGIGGLNVLNEFIKKYPNNHYIYYGDTKNIPYGDKTKEELLKLSKEIINFFENKKVDLIIIACGTISSNCFNELKSITKIPLYNVIDPTINCLKKLNLDKVLVIATNRTIDSHIFKNNLNNVIELKTPEFVMMLENNLIDENVIANYLKDYKDINGLVLGCTHYPLLLDYLKKYLDKKTIIIDMGKVLVNEINIKNDSDYQVELYFTKMNKVLESNINNIIKTKYNLFCEGEVWWY